MLALPSIYGTGYSFPLRLNEDSASPSLSSELVMVRESLMNLITTDISERPFLRRNGVPYGTRIRRILFEDRQTAEELITYEIKRAIMVWEPRVIVTGVYPLIENIPGSNQLLLRSRLFYRLRNTNRDDNFVLPYRITPSA